MSFFNDYPIEEDYTTYGEMLAHSTGQTTVPWCPDPASPNLQSLLSREPTYLDWPFENHLLPDFMQDGQMLPDPSHDMAYCDSLYQTIPYPFGTELEYQTILPSQRISDDGAALEAANTNPDHQKRKFTSDDSGQDANRLPDFMQNEHMPPQPSHDMAYYHGLNDQAIPHPFDTELGYQTVLSSQQTSDDIGPASRKRKFTSDDSGQDAKRLQSSQKPVCQSQPPEKIPEPSTRKKAIPTFPTQQLSPAKILPADKGIHPTKQRQENGKTRVKMKHGVLHAVVDDEWKRAGYHVDHRERFIREDAQQPGAPVLQEEMGLDITSYSPLTQSWTDDPRTVIDRKGRQVLLPAPPKDWVHNPKCEYLIRDGLVMLGQDNMPIKRYDGAPLTISSRPPPWLMEGLRRVLGMTYEDIMARIDLRRNYANGKGKRLLTYSCFTNPIAKYVENNKSLGMAHWFRRKPKASRGNGLVPAGLEDVGPIAASGFSVLTFTPPPETDQSLLPSSVRGGSKPKADQDSETSDGSYFQFQLNSGHRESTAGNWNDTPNFPNADTSPQPAYDAAIASMTYSGMSL